MRNMIVIAATVAACCVAPASATVWTFNDPMTGLQEVPPNASPATGVISGTYDDVSNLLTYSLNFTGLVAPTTAAHFHLGPPGVAGGVTIGPAGFPLGVTFGSYGNSHVLSATQENDFLAGLWYFNIHTQAFQGGEIRGQINPVPAPGVGVVLGLGGWLMARRRR